MTQTANSGHATPRSKSALPAKFSPRDIGDYRVCPRKVWFRRVAQMQDGQTNTPTLMLGNAIHAALYLFFGLALRDRQPVEQRLHACLRAIWKGYRQPGLFASMEAERAQGHKALDLLTQFARSFSTDVVPVRRERWVRVVLPNRVTLYGKADRIDAVPPDAASRQRGMTNADTESVEEAVDVVDYKTGLRTIDEEDLPDDPAAQIYFLGTEATLRRPVRRVRIAYLAHGIETRWEPERDDIDQLRDHLTDLTSRMRADATFEAEPGAHCMHCPYAEVCPDAGDVHRETLDVIEVAVPF
jgi:RecB family exonuclease